VKVTASGSTGTKSGGFSYDPALMAHPLPTRWRADLIVPNGGTNGPGEASVAALTVAARAPIVECRAEPARGGTGILPG
jgi:hypothetical protein